MFPNFAIDPDTVERGLARLPDRPGRARALPEDPQRCARRRADDAQVRLAGRPGRHAPRDHLPGRPDVPDRRQSSPPRAATRSSSGSTASTSRRRWSRAAGSRAVGMIWLRADRPEHVDGIMRAVDDALPELRGRGRRRDGEVVLRELLQLLSGHHPRHPRGRLPGRRRRRAHRRQHERHGRPRACPRDRGAEEPRLPAPPDPRRAARRVDAPGAHRRPRGRRRGVRHPERAQRRAGRRAAWRSSGRSGSSRSHPRSPPRAWRSRSLVGIVSGVVPAWNGARLPVVDALRRLF